MDVDVVSYGSLAVGAVAVRVLCGGLSGHRRRFRPTNFLSRVEQGRTVPSRPFRSSRTVSSGLTTRMHHTELITTNPSRANDTRSRHKRGR